MKKIIIALILGMLIIPINNQKIYADGSGYSFVLTIDGNNEKNVETGDTVTASLTLKCNNGSSCRITAFQDEVYYDSEFYELVPGSMMTMNGVKTNDVGKSDRYRAVYMNYVAIDGPINLETNTKIGTFELKVLATTGVSHLKNENCEVANENGEQETVVQTDAENVTVIRSQECEVHVKDDDGNLIEDKIVEYQKTMKKPTAKNDVGQVIEEFTKDPETEPWDFKEDKVEENMTISGEYVDATEADSNNLSIIIIASGIGIIAIVGIIIVISNHNK